MARLREITIGQHFMTLEYPREWRIATTKALMPHSAGSALNKDEYCKFHNFSSPFSEFRVARM